MRTRLGAAALLLLLATTAAADPLFQVRLRELGVTEVDESNATGVAIADPFEASGPRVANPGNAAPIDARLRFEVAGIFTTPTDVEVQVGAP